MAVNQYNFQVVDKLAQQAAKEITAYLEERGFTVKDAQHNKYYQRMDIDLLAFKDGRIYWIEIKADRYYKTGNYFAEYISNNNTKSLGCWFQTKSHYIFYYFVEEKELHIIPTKEAQAWVEKHSKDFKIREVKTGTKNGDKVYYSSAGYLVPRSKLQENVDVYIENL